MSWSLACVSDTVNWPGSDGSEALLSFAVIEATAVSSSAIVTVAELALVSTVTSVSLVPVKVRITVSAFSSTESSITLTSMVAEVCPAKMVTEDGKVTKSVPSPAVPVTAKVTSVS